MDKGGKRQERGYPGPTRGVECWKMALKINIVPAFNTVPAEPL